MARYILRRLVGMVFLLVVVSGITFLVFNVFPPPIRPSCARGASRRPELIETIRQDLGLDRPWPVQFGDYIYNVFVHLDFGRSYQTNQDVLAAHPRRPARHDLARRSAPSSSGSPSA